MSGTNFTIHKNGLSDIRISGKSTYLRQIGLLAVMAMSGCFIPAEYGSFRYAPFLFRRVPDSEEFLQESTTRC